MPLDDVHQEWFARISRDLLLLCGAFREVLEELGDADLAHAVPWCPGWAPPAANGSGNPGMVDRELQVLSIAFQLLNLAEENAAVEARRFGEEKHGVLYEPGLWGHQLLRLRDLGFSPEAIAAELGGVRVEVVLTAHPTEAKRPVVLKQHRALFDSLQVLSQQHWTVRERDAQRKYLKVQIERLWRTGEMYLYKPDVSSELTNILDYFRMVFPQAVLALDARLRASWAHAGFAPELLHGARSLPRVTFGNWVGGDRDGHPLVTAEVTRETLHRLRQCALDLMRQQLDGLYNNLSLSDLYQPASEGMLQAIEERTALLGAEGEDIVARNPREPWRQFIRLMSACLPFPGVPAAQAYKRPTQLAEDLEILHSALKGAGAKRLAEAEVEPVQRLLDIFGFHTAALDIRQNSAYHEQALMELLAAAGMSIPGYAEWDEARRAAFLNEELRTLRPLAPRGMRLGPHIQEVLDTYEVLAAHIRKHGHGGLGALIVSMCRGASDLLTVYVLAREAGLLRATEDGIACHLQVVPLFETGEDLKQSPAILAAFLDHPITRESLAHQRVPRQQAMLGYSDSNKTSGLFASHWRLHMSQYYLTELGNARGVRVEFFHGRGGTNSRGAGPTHRFMDSLANNSLSGHLRLTEQGETIAQKYGTPPSAAYNIELLLAASAATTVRHRIPYERNERRVALGERIADYSEAAYRALLDTENFLAFWSQATPIDVLEQSFIGSRPTRRTGRRSIEDLRAIPWVFSWLQSRYYLPAWYGLGSALERLEREDAGGFAFLKESAQAWPFMRYVLFNAETSLASADLELMRAYAGLVEDESIRERVFSGIAAEYARTETQINNVFGAPRNVRRPRMHATLALRESGLRVLHLRQIALLREWRTLRKAGEEEAAARLLPSLLLSINAIASGERTTG